MKRGIELLCLLLGLAVFSVWASFPVEFEEIDENADGSISMDEAKVRTDLLEKFHSIDINGDGKINIAEYQKYEGKGRFAPAEETEIPELGAAPIE